MNILLSKSIEEVLKSYEFSHRFYVKYALAVARLANNEIRRPDPTATKCLDLVQLWLDSNDNSTVVTDSELRDAAYAVAAYAASAAYAAYAAAAYAAAADAAYAVYWAEKSGIKTKVLKSLLFEMLQTEFTELERILLGLT